MLGMDALRTLAGAAITLMLPLASLAAGAAPGGSTGAAQATPARETPPPVEPASAVHATPARAQSPAAVGRVRIVAAPETVFDWRRQACEPAEVPDLPVRAFRDYRGRVQLLLSHYEDFRLIGASLRRLHRDCRAVMRSPENASPSRFEDREWLASLYTTDGRTVWALVDEEYQGNRHPGRCRSGSYFQCWYNAVTLARSANGGRSYTHKPAPRQLVAAPATPYAGGGGPVGVFTPSNIVTGPDGAHYALVRVRGPDGAHGDCLLRSTRVGSASAWRAWNGHGYGNAFPDPYAARAQAGPGCAQVGAGDITEMTESLTYSTALHRYLLVGLAPPGPTSVGAQATGIYFATSSDLIHWSPRTLIAPAVSVPTYACGQPSPIAYPSVVDPSSRSRTYATSGGSPFLYYTQFLYEGCRQTADRNLMRVRLQVSP
jgi:hypothetical protein